MHSSYSPPLSNGLRHIASFLHDSFGAFFVLRQGFSLLKCSGWCSDSALHSKGVWILSGPPFFFSCYSFPLDMEVLKDHSEYSGFQIQLSPPPLQPSRGNGREDSMFLLNSDTPATQYFWPQMCAFFPHQTMLCNTSWAPTVHCNSDSNRN